MSRSFRNNVVSAGNSSSTLITNGNNFTGTWENVARYDSLTLAVSTDQNGYFEIQFSPDGTNVDSTLTRYYRTGQINAPHRFTITREHFRIRFFNNSGVDQTYFRLQTIYGDHADLNIPVDSTMAQDYDAISVRPTDFHTEVALGRRQGSTTWNKFGYNLDIDAGTEEIIASWGGAFDPTSDIMSSEQTFSIAFNDTTDGSGSTGALTLLFTYLDKDFNLQTATHVLTGTSPDTTSFEGVGINRVVVLSSGSAGLNNNDITITASTDLTTQAQIPGGASVTQQAIFHTPINHQFLAEWLYLSPAGTTGLFFPVGAKLNVKAYSWSRVTSTRYDVGDFYLDVSAQSALDLSPPVPFVIGGREVLYFTSTTDTNNTQVSCRFSGELVRDPTA